MKKWGFYLLSMTFFLIIVIILGFKMPESWTDCYIQPGMCISIVCILVLFIATIFYIYLHSVKSKGTLLGPILISEAKNINFDIMSFFASYCFPLVSFSINDSWRHVIVLGFLFILIGKIYVGADIYYYNPTLLLFGFRVYRIKGTIVGVKEEIEKVVIVRGTISTGDKLKYIPIDKTTYYAIKL